jgi:hypothetical protein
VNPRFDRQGSNELVGPGPGSYEVVDPSYMVKGKTKAGFGSAIPRTTLIHRDVSKSPFRDPTRLDNPAPSKYDYKGLEMSTITKSGKQIRN